MAVGVHLDVAIVNSGRPLLEPYVNKAEQSVKTPGIAINGSYTHPVLRALMSEDERSARLAASISGLADREPVVSARRILTEPQRNGFIALGVVTVIGCIVSWVVTLQVYVSVITFLYVAAIIYRLNLFHRSSMPETCEVVSDDEARAYPAEWLPVYTVLIPAYREPEVIRYLIDRVTRFEYPPDRLDVKLLIEEDDQATIDAVMASRPGDQFELVLIPAAEPRTKPKALNYGLTLARGSSSPSTTPRTSPSPCSSAGPWWPCADSARRSAASRPSSRTTTRCRT